ncbi:MAG TPA: hypothetical protein VF824_13440 [Thermoanaerobaculia bacterium]|jgi:hypothetical protein
MRSLVTVMLAAVLAAAVAAPRLSAATCVNRFVSRSERQLQIVTLLTGKLTFQEAQALAKAVAAKQSPPLEWVDEKGKTIARQFGDLQVVRPMPVGCDGKTSGVVMIASFGTGIIPSKKMHVKLDAQTTVAFEQQ